LAPPLSSPRRALLIAHAYPPENLIGAERPARFARYLPTHGYEAWILTASQQPHPPPERLREVPFHYNPLELALGKTFFPCDDRMTWGPKAFRAGADWLANFPGASIVFSTSPPLSSHWAAWRLARRFGLPWVADFRDPLVANFGRRGTLGRPVDSWIEKRVLRHANAVIMNTAAAAGELRSRYPSHAHKIDAIPNGYDPADGFGPLPLPKRDRRVWLHGGSLYRNRYPERLFDSLWRLTESEKLPRNWKVRMIGSLEDRSLLERPSVKALSALGAVEIHAEVLPKAMAMREIAEADGSMVFDHYHSSGANLAIPAKSFDCVRTGRPVLAFTSPGAPMERMLAASGVPCTRIFEEDSPSAIDQKLLEFSAMPSGAVTPSEAFRLDHAAPQQTGRLAALFDKLLRS
jgi:glycosyltransferase involved in cell wall biosynthesis